MSDIPMAVLLLSLSMTMGVLFLGCVPPVKDPPVEDPPVIILPPVEEPDPPPEPDPLPMPVRKWVITITWNESQAQDVDHYNVYVNTGGTESVLRPRKPPAEVQVWDRDGPPRIWVTSVDKTGNESERSDSVVVDLVETAP